MEHESPVAVATAFLERFGDGKFEEVDASIHPEGPLEGAGEMAAISSMLVTDFLATVVLGVVPTEVTETTLVEEGPTTARVEASLDIAGLTTVDALVELRPSDYDGNDLGDGRRTGWRVWSVDAGLEG